MTIKQLADRLGVSKEQVRYRLRKMPADSVELIDGVYHVTDSAIHELTEFFETELASKSVNIRNDDAPRIIQLETENRMLREQVKDLHALIERIAAHAAEKHTDQRGTIQGHMAFDDLSGTPRLGLFARFRARKDQ